MTEINGSRPLSEILSPESLEAPVAAGLEAALGMAQLTRFPAVHPSHIALALLSADQGFLDTALRKRFAGLRAATITESLLEVLEIEADLTGSAAGSLPGEGLPAPEHLAAEAQAVLRRAGELAAGRGAAHIGLPHLIRALFESPERFLAEAFGDAGVTPADLQDLAEKLDEGAASPTSASPPAVFAGGRLDLALFGPLARAALQALARAAAAQPDPPLRDVDLLIGFLEREDSRLVAALHLLGVPVAGVRRGLASLSGRPSAARGAAELPEERIGRLLRRVLAGAAALAAKEGFPLVSESHLLRAHLDRVAEGGNNLYQRLGIDTIRLRSYLQRYPEDRASEEAGERAEPIADIETFLRSRVVHQDHAVRRVVPALARLRTGMAEAGRPMGVFLFLGPSGVGKTELARAIAEVAFGPKSGVRDPYLIKLDCGSFVDKRDIVQLLGAAQGLVGYKEGQLTNGLREKPRSVILFNEAEKADPHIWQSLLPLFEDGIVREADGTEYDATSCIVAATSNLGYKEAIQQLRLWDVSPEQRVELQPQVEDLVWSRVEEYFSPEFRSRFGRQNVIFFHHFDPASYEHMVRMQVERLIEEMEERGFEVKVPEKVRKFLAKLAWDLREEGARPVRRLITEHLRDQIVTAVTADPRRTAFRFTALEGRGEIVLEG